MAVSFTLVVSFRTLSDTSVKRPCSAVFSSAESCEEDAISV